MPSFLSYPEIINTIYIYMCFVLSIYLDHAVMCTLYMIRYIYMLAPPLRSTFDALLETYMVKLNDFKGKFYLIH